MIIERFYGGYLPISRIYRGGELIWWAARDHEFGGLDGECNLIATVSMTQPELTELAARCGICAETVASMVLQRTIRLGSMESVLLVTATAQDSQTRAVFASKTCAVESVVKLGDAVVRAVAVIADTAVQTEADLRDPETRPVGVADVVELAHIAAAVESATAPVTASETAEIGGAWSITDPRSASQVVKGDAAAETEAEACDAETVAVLSEDIFEVLSTTTISASGTVTQAARELTQAETMAQIRLVAPQRVGAGVVSPVLTYALLEQMSIAEPWIQQLLEVDTVARLTEALSMQMTMSGGASAETLAAADDPLVLPLLGSTQETTETAAELDSGDVRSLAGAAEVKAESLTIIQDGEVCPAELRGMATVRGSMEATDSETLSFRAAADATAETVATPEQGDVHSTGIEWETCLIVEAVADDRPTTAVAALAETSCGTAAEMYDEKANRVAIMKEAMIQSETTLHSWAKPIRDGTNLLIRQAAKTKREGTNLLIM